MNTNMNTNKFISDTKHTHMQVYKHTCKQVVHLHTVIRCKVYKKNNHLKNALKYLKKYK